MNIVDMSKFEAKLREAEERLGIRPENRVPVVYERNSDTAGKLLASIIVVAILLAIITRSKLFKVSINMDSIVSRISPTTPQRFYSLVNNHSFN